LRRKAVAIVSAVLAAGALWGVSATAASAGGGVMTFFYPNGQSHNFPCTVGTKGSTQSGDGQWPNLGDNGCTTRVILYENPGETGITLCLAPITNTVLHRTWRSFRVGSDLSC
jgi:hypothetical protein